MAKFIGLWKRSFITPITTASFVVVALTGILMLVDVKNATIKELHELVSVLFVVAAGLHLILNWNCFVTYLRKPLTILLAVAVAALVALMFTGNGSGGRPPVMAVLGRIAAAPLAQTASFLGVSVEESLTRLKEQGLQVSGESESIADIAKNNGRDAMEIVGFLLGSAGKPDRGGAGSTSEVGSPPPRR